MIGLTVTLLGVAALVGILVLITADLNDRQERMFAPTIVIVVVLVFWAGAAFQAEIDRTPECALRFEVAVTDSARLAVVREYPYCLERMP